MLRKAWKRQMGSAAARAAEAVIDFSAGDMTCPACQATFATGPRACPDCGLFLG